jgi:ATPase family associated with various cellular activities (AAA)/AAA+ lid domain
LFALDCTRKMSGGNRSCILREQVASGQIDMNSPQSPSPIERLKVLINSSTPIVVMETVEEVRALTLVRTACSELNLAFFEWTIADGLVRSGSGAPAPPPVVQARVEKTSMWSSRDQVAHSNTRVSTTPPGNSEAERLARAVLTSLGSDAGAAPAPQKAAIYNSTDPVQALANLESMAIEAVFVLKDFHRHMDNPVVVRRLRDVGQKFSANRRTLVLTAPAIEMPPELASLVEFLDLPLPDRDRLREIIRETYTRLAGTHTLKLQLDANGVDAMAANLRGLTEEAAERAISQTVVGRLALSPDCLTDVLDAKKALLKRSEMLEFVDAIDNMASVGGLDNLKHWLQQRRGSWDDQARQFGLDPPKGVIILGVQGCGKSLCARAVAGEWKLPLVKFDTAAVYDKFIGETEKRIQKVFRVAEGLAPCVLWIDELEKVFAGSGPDSASADAGVSSRLLAAFLSWMQERKPAVFVAATCNNVTVLPPELIRKGRFDELFFVDLPSAAERKQIFSIQLTKRKRNPADYDLDRVAEAAKGFSGAEIESAVQTALYAAFARKQELSTDDLLTALSSTVPLSVTRAEEIAELRAWAKDRAVWASAQGTKEARV